MTTSRELNVGQIYYIIQYHDEKLTRPIVSSCVYKGRSDEGSGKGDHLFTLIGFANEELFWGDRNLDLILDLQGLIRELNTPDLARKGIDHAFLTSRSTATLSDRRYALHTKHVIARVKASQT